MLPESMPINSLRDGDDTPERLTPQQLAEIRQWHADMTAGLPSWYDIAEQLLEHITALEAAVQERQGMELTAHQYHENWKTAEATVTALEAEKSEVLEALIKESPCACVTVYGILSKQEHE